MLVPVLFLYFLLGDLQGFYGGCKLLIVGQLCDGYFVESGVEVPGPVGYRGGVLGLGSGLVSSLLPVGCLLHMLIP